MARAQPKNYYPPSWDGTLIHNRVTPSSMSPVPIYTPGWTVWGKGRCFCLSNKATKRICCPPPPPTAPGWAAGPSQGYPWHFQYH